MSVFRQMSVVCSLGGTKIFEVQSTGPQNSMLGTGDLRVGNIATRIVTRAAGNLDISGPYRTD